MKFVAKYLTKQFRPAMIGTAIEYYDITLYGYMAPILIQVFLPFIDPLSAYFYYFSFEIFAAICQISGSYIFGKIGDRQGRKKAMYYSMFGTSFVTFLICMVPTYKDLGIYAAILFASCRAMQSFFLGGEYNGGAIYCLEHEKNKNNHGKVSGIYGGMTVFGVLIAAITSACIMHFGKEYFRVAYFFSFLFALLTFFLRRQVLETPEFIAAKIEPRPVFLNKKWSIFFKIALISTLSGVLYGLPTRIFNAILPIATDINSVNIMTINSITIVFYMLFLVFFGFLADMFAPIIVIKRALMAIIFLVIPLVSLIENKTIFAIITAKLFFAALSAAVVGPFHAWTQSISRVGSRYSQVSMAYSAGKIGAIMILPITIIIFERFNSLVLSSLILVLLASISHLILRKTS